MITYLFHTTLLISGFTLFYWLILRRETYFRLNRWVILGSVVFCMVLPFLEIPPSMSLWNDTDAPTQSIIETIAQAPAQLINNKSESTAAVPYPADDVPANQTTGAGSYSWMTILGLLYIVGLIIFFLVFLVQIVILLTQRYNLNSFQTGKYTIVELVKDAEPCSFLNYIFINPTKYDPETYSHIIEHEKAHIDQSHFIDKVVAELLVVVFWFNPFTWLLRESISQNLEFLTDQSLLKQGIQKEKYQMSLLKVSVSNRPLNLTASYNSSFLKSRINMMNAKNSSVVSAWKYLFILPLFVLSVASLNAIQDNDNKATNNDASWTETIKNQAPSTEGLTTNHDKDAGYVSQELDLPHINKIGLGMSGNLILSYGKEQQITISGPEELVDQISTVVNDSDWNISYKEPGPRSLSNKITVHAQLTDLTNLALSGDGNITTTNKFENLNQMFIALSGAGNIEFAGDGHLINTALSGTGNIQVISNAEKVHSAISGTGNVTFTGSASETKFICSGSGNISAKELKSKRSTVIVDGSSAVSLYATDYLDVKANGATVVSYRGTPTIKKEIKAEARLLHIE